MILGTLWFTVLAWVLLGAVLDRLKWIRAVDRLDFVPTGGTPGPGAGLAPGRPLFLSRAWRATPSPGSRWRSPRTSWSRSIGDNGSGKSTLARILAGLPPDRR